MTFQYIFSRGGERVEWKNDALVQGEEGHTTLLHIIIVHVGCFCWEIWPLYPSY